MVTERREIRSISLGGKPEAEDAEDELALDEPLCIFVNGEYSGIERVLDAGDRLALFPDDMQLLYKWYFARRK